MKFKMTLWNTSYLYHFKIFYEKYVTNNRTVHNFFFRDGGYKCLCLNHKCIIKVEMFSVFYL